MSLEFQACAEPTVGIELELQLLDAESLSLINAIGPLMELYSDKQFVKPEFFQSSVELTSPVCNSTTEARAHMLETLHGLIRRCDELGMALCGAGTHAFDQRLALITPVPRYLSIEREFGFTALTQVAFSTHVHVGMPSGNAAIFVMRHLAPCLPALLAIAANSPFWHGYDTGYAGYRHCILAAAQSYGLPGYFSDWNDFVRFWHVSRRAHIIEAIRDIHWDIRPRPALGTLELRIMDAASTIEKACGLAAFARSLMVYLTQHASADLDPRLPDRLPHHIERINRYRAFHHGLAAEYICDETGKTQPARKLVEDLLELVTPVADGIGEDQGLRAVHQMLIEGPGYACQRKIYKDSGSMQDLTRTLTGDLRHEVLAQIPVRQ